MSRIPPIEQNSASPAVRIAFQRHIQASNARITNMKATLAHCLPAFEVYMQWYPLYERVKAILGRRLAGLFAFSISKASDCPLCSTYFRKIILDSGEDPSNLVLSEEEKEVLVFGSAIAKYQGNIADGVYNALARRYSKEEMVTLVAFAGQMIATNIFNNVVETEIDDYLNEYLPPVRSLWEK
ncbi:MAG: hypothetical protein HZA79_03760 [Sphingobacteriales bacterium]|nr:hypothetical protein [Sphingobacteriales bacterium]